MEILMKEKDNKELEELTADMPKKKLPVWSKIVIGVVIAVLAIGGIAYGVFSYNYGKIYVRTMITRKHRKSILMRILELKT